MSVVVQEVEQGRISGVHRVETGLHYWSKSSSMWRMIQT